MNETYRNLEPEEQKYLFPQSSQIAGQTGCVGHLYAKADPDGDAFVTLWEDEKRYLRTEEFLEDYPKAMQLMRTGDGPLKDKETTREFCKTHPEARLDNGEYGIRLDTFRYAYLFRIDPREGKERFTVSVYRRNSLDQHIQGARRGIRFTDLQYRDKFRIKDGGAIKITYPDRTQVFKNCRYIDEYHLQIENSIYHVCEFAEWMAKDHCRVEPVYAPERIEPGKERAYAGSGR